MVSCRHPPPPQKKNNHLPTDYIVSSGYTTLSTWTHHYKSMCFLLEHFIVDLHVAMPEADLVLLKGGYNPG